MTVPELDRSAPTVVLADDTRPADLVHEHVIELGQGRADTWARYVDPRAVGSVRAV